MIKDSLFWKGSVLGLILPTLAFVIYANLKMDGDILALYYQLEALDVHIHVLSLCTFLNLIPFLIFVRAKRDKPAQGILMVTILLAMFILINKLVL